VKRILRRGVWRAIAEVPLVSGRPVPVVSIVHEVERLELIYNVTLWIEPRVWIQILRLCIKMREPERGRVEDAEAPYGW